VSIARSSFYYEGRGESPLNLRLMRLIDEQFLETPFYGLRQMTRWLPDRLIHAADKLADGESGRQDT
jgi:putative transposase